MEKLFCLFNRRCLSVALLTKPQTSHNLLFCLELVQREHGRKKESRCQKGLYFCCLCSRLSSHQRPNCLFSQLQAYILSVVPTRCFPSRLLPFILASLSLSAFLFYLYWLKASSSKPMSLIWLIGGKKFYTVFLLKTFSMNTFSNRCSVVCILF